MLQGAGDGGSPVKCDELYSVSHQALRTCANPFLKGFMCLKQETSENHSNMYVLSASTHRELKLGHEATEAPSCWKNHPFFLPQLMLG